VDFIALFVFIVVQILFLPLSIFCFILVAYKQMYVSKRLGVSGSAIEVINGRWTLDVFGIRNDTSSVKVNHVLPNNSLPGMWISSTFI